MSSDSTATAPSFDDERTINELMLPVVAGALHERALPLAASLASVWQLPVRLIHVTDSISSQDPALEATIEGARSWYPTMDVTSKHVYGEDPAIAIAQELGPHTLAVLATDHIDKWRFKDSVAESLVNHAGQPILLIGPNVRKADVREGALDGEIVVGLDGSLAAESALQPAMELARALQRAVWLVTVVAEPSAGEPLSPATPGRYLQEVAERYSPDVGVRWEVIQNNDPVDALESFAKRRHASFLVASTGGRTDSRHHSMASIASGLVAAAARPVLILKSEETPAIDAG